MFGINPKKSPYLLAVMSVTLLSGCADGAESEATKRQNTGYGDGYAVGYNTACEIRATVIEGAWDDKNYSSGYAKGIEAGIISCIAFKKSANR